MKDEIKEILDKLNDCKWKKDAEEIAYKILFSNEVYKLLDYITNLQEGNHNLLEEIEDMQNKNNKLIEENERLNNILNELEEYILNHYIVGHTIQNASLDDIINKLKELKGESN